MTVWLIAVVLAAGTAGALARFGVARLLAGRAGFPWAVFAVNTVGSALGGAAIALQSLGILSADTSLILLTGLCGGLTTFSTWSVETIQLVIDGKGGVAVANVVAGLGAGLVAAAGCCLLLVALLG